MRMFTWKQPFISSKFGLIGLFLVLVAMNNCTEGNLDMGSNFLHTSTYTALVDSLSIRFSTIKTDSVITSGSQTGLVGFFENPLIGKQKASSYFSIYPPSDFVWDEDKEVLDSLCFVFKTNGYSIGDTTSNFRFQVHQLEELIELNDDGYLYNTSSVPYNDMSSGESTVYVRPSLKETIEIRLADELATSMRDFLIENKNVSEKNTLFRETFKGFVVTCDTSVTKAIIGMDLGTDSVFVRMYSHIVTLEKERFERDFDVQTASYHFNQISTTTSEAYASIDEAKDILPSTHTDNQCFLQTGTGYGVRVDFEFFDYLMELKKQGRIVRADLIVQPVKGTFKPDKLYNTLYLSTINKLNTIEDYVYGSDGSYVTSSFVMDQIYNESTYYYFDVTAYLNMRISEVELDSDDGVLISFPDELAGNSLDYLVLGGEDNTVSRSKLNIYYYYYDTE